MKVDFEIDPIMVVNLTSLKTGRIYYHFSILFWLPSLQKKASYNPCLVTLSFPFFVLDLILLC